MSAPLIVREWTLDVPPTWCVLVCEHRCYESWTVDSCDWTPQLTVADVERMLAPLLLAHEAEQHADRLASIAAAGEAHNCGHACCDERTEPNHDHFLSADACCGRLRGQRA